jgi:hypothetical protein
MIEAQYGTNPEIPFEETPEEIARQKEIILRNYQMIRELERVNNPEVLGILDRLEERLLDSDRLSMDESERETARLKLASRFPRIESSLKLGEYLHHQVSKMAYYFYEDMKRACERHYHIDFCDMEGKGSWFRALDKIVSNIDSDSPLYER